MEKDTISMVLYPILVDGISFKQKEAIKKIFHNFPEEELQKLFRERISLEDVHEISKKLTDAEKIAVFKEAKEIAEIDYITRNQFEEFAEFGNILGISREDCGFDINIYDKNDILEYEYKRTLTNFSLISASVAFLPIPLADFFAITPLQVAMVSKIASLLNFELNSAKFLKMIAGTIGSGFIFRTSSKLLGHFLPFRWLLKAGIAYAGTYAIGILAKSYIEVDGDLSEEAMKEIWKNALEEGKEEAGHIKDILLANKDVLIKRAKEYIHMTKNKAHRPPAEEPDQKPAGKKSASGKKKKE